MAEGDLKSTKLCKKLANDFHLLLDVSDEKSMNIFLQTPSDIWKSSKSNSNEIFCDQEFNLLRQGRHKELHEIWEAISCVLNQFQRRDLLYIHGSPGMGKTFLLRELLKRNIDDIPHHLHRQAQVTEFFALHFARLPTSHPEESFKSHPRLFIVARIFYLQFTNQELLGWRYFVENYLIRAIDNNYSEEMVDALIHLFHRQAKGFKKILVVDDISNLLENNFANHCRSQICSLMEEGVFDAVLFTTKDIQFLLKEREATGRPVRSATTLRFLTNDESLHLLASSLKVLPIEETNYLADPMKLLISVGTGHPGSLVTLINRCNLRANSIQGIIGEAADDLFGCQSHLVNCESILRAIILNESVSPSDMLDGLSYEQLIGMGYLVGSLTETARFLPRSPRLFLYKLIQTEEKVSSVIRNQLCRILQLQNTLNNQDEVHRNWEILIRYFRTENHARIPFQNLYQLNSRETDSESILNVKINGRELLTSVPYEQNSFIKLCANNLYYPSCKETEVPHGWNQMITLEAFPQGYHQTTKRFILPIFIFDSNQPSHVMDVNEAHYRCQHVLSKFMTRLQGGWHFLPKRSSWPLFKSKIRRYEHNFILLYVTQEQRPWNPSSTRYANVILCSQSERNAWYGPTLSCAIDVKFRA